MEGYHSSVLLREAVDALISPKSEKIRDAWYIDCTLGDGGHSIEIISRGGKVLGIDADPQALERVHKRFTESGIDEERLRLVQGNFRDLKTLLQTEPVGKNILGVLFDLGVSSLQLGSPERGFSFAKNGPLDMRMDPRLEVRALDLIKILSKGELDELFYKLGEEKHSRQLSSALVSARQVRSFESTKQLADFVADTYRRLGVRKAKIHPATKVFQALRIAVNDELNALKEALPQALEVVNKNGRVVVISFHSLEDRIVKTTFKNWQIEDLGKVLTDKPIKPKEDEIKDNPRARSAKMRIFEKK